MSAILDTYKKRTPKSAEAEARAGRSIIGGNSRGAAFWLPHPVHISSGNATRLTDIDGNEYLHAINNFTSLAHGHSYPPIVEAVSKQIGAGTAWTGNNHFQVELAELLIDRVPSLESARFVNSGSEAGILALTIARVVTGRNKVLMSTFGYHGILMEFEMGLFVPAGLVEADSPHAANTLLATYNDAESFERVLEEHGDEIAAVFLEPIQGAGGVNSATPEFIKRVQAATKKAGALLVLDEVISFRLSTGGTQMLLDVEPDLTMFGKIIGGGYPVGAVGGKREHMAIFDPVAPRALHSGTFCGNPVTMAAGLVSVRELTAGRIDNMDRLGERLESSLHAGAKKAGLPLTTNRRGSLLQVYFSEQAPVSVGNRQDDKLMSAFYLAALNHGLMTATRGMFSLSTVMDEATVDEIGERAGAAMADVAAERN